MEFMSGLMIAAMKEIGSIIKCMGRACISGKMEESMKGSTSMIRNMVSVVTLGLMAADI